MTLRSRWSALVGNPQGWGAGATASLFDATTPKSLAFAIVDMFGAHDPKLVSALKWELSDQALNFPPMFVSGSLECIQLFMKFICSLLSTKAWAVDPGAMMFRWAAQRARGNRSCFLGVDASQPVLFWSRADMQVHQTYTRFLQHEAQRLQTHAHGSQGGGVHAFLCGDTTDVGEEAESCECVALQGAEEVAQAAASGAPLYNDHFVHSVRLGRRARTLWTEVA